MEQKIQKLVFLKAISLFLDTERILGSFHNENPQHR